ncbi:hypothetical protein N136_04902 [Leifsonia aquatica ATCC 14665]|uniref:Uncharacterized protein n=1 Tax=Leifsonia aquatica ATCC 14665 TaxID=1358026 RepID=U2SDX6_LEIAQ|nr:hypothetical protein N136_04902 [Leifsonia aquatica ATCC 14665]
MYALRLRLFDRFGEVVVAGEEVERVDGAVAGVADHVESDSQVDAFLFPVYADPSESEFHAGEESDPFMFGFSDAVACGVVPVDAEERQPASLFDDGDELVDEVCMVDGHPSSQ